MPKQELQRERYKNSALETAMQQPLNVHRWRLLKGTDPEKYELLESYQTAQKKLLKKKKYVEKANYSQLLKEKNDKIKTLSFEINMNETYMSSYQTEISHLKEEIRKMKLKQFFREKKEDSSIFGKFG
ncbi:cilia-and flagella-associated protein 58 [Caerostris extrusa]|uniref:Cilia-and flagella-associated protein 58 n=1 Tax=Caerostris extrusa TaxID=172846 RepID=A0AAV4XHL1_CAEEX|nr:cilia-and flagella-associated protein 58 [Caerostris extrusa]